MATIVIVHGAWGGGWAWAAMEPLLAARGHRLLRPTLTGLGDRAHLASPEVSLDTHVQDVVALLEMEDLREVVLVGHSYGGMVVTGAADRVAERIARLGYIDALVPEDGDSVLALLPPEAAADMRARAAAGAGWRIAPNPIAADTPEALHPWLAARRLPQPLRTFDQPIRLAGRHRSVPRDYVYCLRIGPGDVFGRFATKARTEPGWRCLEIDATHTPNVTAREPLAELLDRIATGR